MLRATVTGPAETSTSSGDGLNTSGVRLLVLERESSTVRQLEPERALTIGAAPEVDLRLTGEAVAPRHAVIELRGGELTVRPVDERAAVAVNGRRLGGGSEPLVSGDVVGLGEVTLVVQRRQAPQRRALDESGLRERLGQELERALRGGRTLVVLSIAVDVTEAQLDTSQLVERALASLRYEDLVAPAGEGEILAVLPEAGEQYEVPLSRLLGAMQPAAPMVRAGVARCPQDALTVDDLITGARAAARAAEAGEVAPVGQAADVRPVGGQHLITLDPKMSSLLGLVARLARSDMPVLVVGETGVGKELVALALHHWSDRAGAPMVPVNCGAVTEALFESELFGHERGAFTGAVSGKPGRFEQVGAGTLFLDEIGECPLSTQVKLLRVLEARRANRVGGLDEYEIGARVVAATNRDLEEEVEQGRFRRDLLYRLNAATVVVPPLRDRPLEIPALARHFLSESCRRLGRPALELEPAALQRLGLHRWPGNIRELKHAMDYCAATAEEGRVGVEALPAGVADDAPPWLLGHLGTSGGRRAEGPLVITEPGGEFPDIRLEVRRLERTRMIQALERTGGVRVRAAELMGMPLRTFVTKLKVYGISISSPHGQGEG